MTLSDKQFKDLHLKLTQYGGFSANANTGQPPKSGYMVSYPGTEQQIPTRDVSPTHLKDYLGKHGNLLKEPDRYFGGWKDDDEGEVSLDVSQNITPDTAVAREYGDAVADTDARTSAEDLAVARNQKAGWDVVREKELPNRQFRGR